MEWLILAGDIMLCQLEPLDASWHYRTKISPLPEVKCWYDGPRMKPRRELYWAEAPALQPPPTPEPENEFELRWKGIYR